MVSASKLLFNLTSGSSAANATVSSASGLASFLTRMMPLRNTRQRFDKSSLQSLIITVLILGIGGIALIKYWQFKSKLEREEKKHAQEGMQSRASADGTLPRKPRGSLDSQFFGRLKLLLSIVVPSYKSLEFAQLIALAIIVISRTLLSNWLSSLSGDISKNLLELDFRSFVHHLGLSSTLSFASALLAPTLKYLIDKLSLEWRVSLTKYIHKKYLNNLMYYKTANLTTDIPNPDQILTQDVQKFCDGMCGLYANLLKPMADLMLYTYKLVEIAGIAAPACILGYTLFSFVFITMIRPPFSLMTSRYQNLEGNFRYCHIRSATNGESIAFYGGDELEKTVADQSFMELYKHKQRVNKAHMFFGIFNDFFVFNLPGSVSWLITTMPVFFGDLRHVSRGELAGQLRYLAAVISHEFQAIGEVIHLHTRLTEIAGYTNNVCKLLDSIDDIDAADRAKKSGKIVPGETIKFEGVTLVTPTGVKLAEDVNFEIAQGRNMLVTGPNGAGKSSLFRVLAGLWPIHEGTIHKPGGGQDKTSAIYNYIYYVPQKPYNTVGTLREQIIYPKHTEDCKNISDVELIALLKRVRIDYLVEREGGFDIKKNWDDILSLGEQQRLSMARLFYHRPKYAILDECTSAVSVDIEKNLYQQCKELNITCITISLRPALKPYHDYEFALDGEGGYQVIKLHDN